MLSYGVWQNENTLSAEIRPIETAARRELKLTFKKNKIKIKFTSLPTVSEFAFGYLGEVSIKPTKFVRSLLYLPLKLMEPTITGKSIKQLHEVSSISQSEDASLISKP